MQDWSHATRVGAGPKAETYRISDNKVAKFKSLRSLGFNHIRTGSSVVEELLKESEDAKLMHNARIPVLQPDGVFRIPLKTIWHPETMKHISPFWQKYFPKIFGQTYFPGIVMEYVPGILLESVPLDIQQGLHMRAAAEILRATRMPNFSLERNPDYNVAANTLWNPKTDEIYFIGEPWNPRKS